MTVSAARLYDERAAIVALPTPLPRPRGTLQVPRSAAELRRMAMHAASMPPGRTVLDGRRPHVEAARALLVEMDRAVVMAEVRALREEQVRKPIFGMWSGDIGPSSEISARRCRTLFEAARPYQSVTISLHSRGGMMVEADSIAEIMGAHRGQITVKVCEMAHSAAARLLLAADRRIAAPTARFALHYPEIGSRRLDASTVRAILPVLERSQERLVDLFATGCLQPHAKIRALLAAETKLTAAEALSLGLIDVISLAI